MNFTNAVFEFQEEIELHFRRLRSLEGTCMQRKEKIEMDLSRIRSLEGTYMLRKEKKNQKENWI